MIIDVIATLGGLIIPPAYDFIKKKFINKTDDPEETIGSLATTKPEAVVPYVEAMAKFKETDIKFFNRDVIGVPSQWIVDMRSAIRPLATIGAFFILIAQGMGWMVNVDPGTRAFCEVTVSSWMGSRLTN